MQGPHKRERVDVTTNEASFLIKFLLVISFLVSICVASVIMSLAVVLSQRQQLNI